MRRLRLAIALGLMALAFALCLMTAIAAHASPRCAALRFDVRRAHERVFGLEFPWWYSLGQLQQESRCRNITAFDGGQGIAQFMPATAAAVSKQLGEPLDPYNPRDAVRMQAVFLRNLHRSCPGPGLWVTYQSYNGGCGLLQREMKRAGSWDHKAMRAQCQRRVLTLSSGQKLDLCEVNYNYPVQVERYAAPYRTGPDLMRFW